MYYNCEWCKLTSVWTFSDTSEWHSTAWSPDTEISVRETNHQYMWQQVWINFIIEKVGVMIWCIFFCNLSSVRENLIHHSHTGFRSSMLLHLTAFTVFGSLDLLDSASFCLFFIFFFLFFWLSNCSLLGIILFPNCLANSSSRFSVLNKYYIKIVNCVCFLCTVLHTVCHMSLVSTTLSKIFSKEIKWRCLSDGHLRLPTPEVRKFDFQYHKCKPQTVQYWTVQLWARGHIWTQRSHSDCKYGASN